MYRIHNTLSYVLSRVWPRRPFMSYIERHVGPTIGQRYTGWVN